MAEKKQIETSDATERAKRSGRIVLIVLSLIVLVGFAVTDVLWGLSVALYAVGGISLFALLICLPDLIAGWRGTTLKIKSDLAGDELGLPLVILAFPYRLWQALTEAPTEEIRGWQALFGNNRGQTTSFIDLRKQLRDPSQQPLDRSAADGHVGSNPTNSSTPSSALSGRLENLTQALTSQQRLTVSDAAQQLQVTAVTIRRYIGEFGIETIADAKGIQLLPPHSIEELREVRKLKHSGLSNDNVLAILKEKRDGPLN